MHRAGITEADAQNVVEVATHKFTLEVLKDDGIVTIDMIKKSIPPYQAELDLLLQSVCNDPEIRVERKAMLFQILYYGQVYGNTYTQKGIKLLCAHYTGMSRNRESTDTNYTSDVIGSAVKQIVSQDLHREGFTLSQKNAQEILEGAPFNIAPAMLQSILIHIYR